MLLLHNIQFLFLKRNFDVTAFINKTDPLSKTGKNLSRYVRGVVEAFPLLGCYVA